MKLAPADRPVWFLTVDLPFEIGIGAYTITKEEWLRQMGEPTSKENA